MKAVSFGLILFLLFIFLNSSLIDGKNFHCNYKNVKHHVLDEIFLTCEFSKIKYGKNDTFNTVLPEDPSKQVQAGKGQKNLFI